MAKTKTLEAWVAEDRKIEAKMSSATLALMKHRHAAVREGGFTVSEYARALGKHHSVVSAHVRGYELWLQWTRDGAVANRTPVDAVELAKLGAEKREAVEIVAEAKGVAPTQVRKEYAHEVKHTEQFVRDYAEKIGDRDKAVEIARDFASKQERAREHARERREETRASKTWAYLSLERELGKARRALQNALLLARESDVDDPEQVELLEDTLGNVREILDVLNLAIVGQAEIDWDAEMSRLMDDGK